MRDSAAKRRLFSEFRELCQIVSGLDDIDNKIYCLGLENGIVSSGIISKETGLSSSASGVRLKKLARKGFFMEGLIEPGGKGGRGKGKGRKFVAVPPRIALKDNLTDYDKILGFLDQIDEHLEVLSVEGKKIEEDNWILWSNSLFNHFIQSINSAKREIIILANDCTFATEDVIESLKNAVKRGLKVKIIANKIPKDCQKRFKNAKIKSSSAKYSGPAVAVVDNKIGYQAFQYGQVTIRYGAIVTSNTYFIDKLVSLYNMMNNK